MSNNKAPVYFSSLSIENVKCFGDKQTLDLKDSEGKLSPWTLILGNNGLGKTTLLKCLAWMTTVEESDSNKKEEAGIPEPLIAVKPFMDGIEDDSEYEKLARIGNKVQTVVSASLTINTELGEVPRKDQTIEYSIEIETANGELQDVRPKLVPLPEFKSPKIYAYSASRHMELKNLDVSELTNPVSNLFSDSGELFDATEQLLYQDHAALQENPKGKETTLLEKIKVILTDLLPGIDDPSYITIHAKERAVKIKTPDGSVSLHELSLGYKTMIAWTVDLALKMLFENPESENPLEEPAVVIIDEIDLHLHPTWQRILKAKLTYHFPNTQFICTAHSPFMAQSSERENLCVLKREEKRQNEVVIENDPYIVKGWRIGQVITSDLFGVESERSVDVEKLENQRRELLDKIGRSLEEEEKLKELDKQLQDLPVTDDLVDQNLLDQIRKTAELLKHQGKLI